jgi:lipopolysaccharide export system permease protein
VLLSPGNVRHCLARSPAIIRPIVRLIVCLGEVRLRTLDRYIFREVATTWIAVTGVLLVILVSNQLARVLSQAAANQFPQSVVFSLIALTSAGFLSVIVPIGFFLAIVLALGRLYHESEMAALQACGVGPAGLFRPITVLGVLIIGTLVWLTFFILPRTSARAQEIRTDALREAQFGALEPGRFRTFGGGNVVFYAESVDANHILHNVNVFVDRGPGGALSKPATGKAAADKAATDKSATDKSAAGEPASDEPATAQSATAQLPAAEAGKAPAKTQDSRPNTEDPATPRQDTGSLFEIWVASRAEQRGAGQADQTFVLYDGYRYEGTPGDGEFRIIRFSEGGIPIQLGGVANGSSKAAMKPTSALLKSSRLDDIAELHWRIATPVSVLVLMLLAVPLSRLRPRQGRFGKIGVAILVYFIYSRLLVSGRTWIENSVMPPYVGLWWVHGIALIAAVWLLFRQSPPGRPQLVRAAV